VTDATVPQVKKVLLRFTLENGEFHDVEFTDVSDFSLSQRRANGRNEKELVLLNKWNVRLEFNNGDDGFKIIPNTSGLKETGVVPSLQSSDVEDSSELPR